MINIKTTLSERDRRTLRVIFRYYDIRRLCENFHVSQNVMKEVLKEEGIPLNQVGIGADDIFSKDNEYARKKPGRDEYLRKVRENVTREINMYDSITFKDASRIAYSCGTTATLTIQRICDIRYFLDIQESPPTKPGPGETE